MSESSLVSLCYKNNNLIGFVFGYVFNKILMIMFTAQSNEGRELRIGHAMHYDLFEKAFNEYNIDLIDFHGASRTKDRSYTSFKQEFSSNFVSLPGSFTRF
jgi:lipid II:glycine glycyltransferase (peptidoglycan interpeptide bridge formation enzyme)